MDAQDVCTKQESHKIIKKLNTIIDVNIIH